MSHRHISDHLSDLVETTLSQLEESHVINIVDDYELEPLNMGMIAAFYYVAYTTIELFAKSLKPRTKVKGILETLCWATEFDTIPMRPGDSCFSRLDLHALVANADLIASNYLT